MYNVLPFRYARAFMHVFGGTLQRDDIEHMHMLSQFMSARARKFLYLRIACISDEHKKKTLNTLFKEYHIAHEGLEKLVELLLHHKRLFLIPDILNEIYMLYNDEHGIVEWYIRASDKLSEKDVSSIVDFLHTMTHNTIKPTVTVDPSLIAGLRLQSDTYWWENSVKQKLKALQRTYKGLYGD